MSSLYWLSQTILRCKTYTCSRMADFYWRIEFLSTPTTGNPEVWSYTRSPAPHLRQHVIVVHVTNKHFKTVSVFSASVCVPVFVSCVVVVAPLQPQFRRESLLLFVFIIAKIWQVLTSLLSSFALCSSACIVVQFHSSHRFHHLVSSFALCCASCVVVEFHSSHSFTISPRIVVFVFFFVLLAVLLSSFTPATVSPFLPTY